ncbi:hypothetical protein [Ensifer adhaerens]|uniref:hypothetical protein n=1 Tax=Ensifer adhaerens TaxID=106592 RepID=UPI0007250EBA|nr:hypothetical protein N182_11730 [Sinorhizobium sp. GL2]
MIALGEPLYDEIAFLERREAHAHGDIDAFTQNVDAAIGAFEHDLHLRPRRWRHYAVASELQRTWHRDDAQQWAEIYTKVFPEYQLLIESYLKAQQVEKDQEQLDSQRG